MSKLNLYSIFHLNLSYSSLPESRIKEVVERCYRPLFQLADDFNVGIGIEASAYTLEKIKETDPSLIEKLKKLINAGKCEFIGSGYMQLIGPLVPAEVNEYNQKIGNDVYKEILGVKPSVAYINEQSYSQGLLSHYIKEGYEAIVMEWNNPAKFHPEWKAEFQYHPQYAVDSNGNSIKLIWNNSISFQKFQRYSSGEIELDEYLMYLKSHVGKTKRYFPIYGSDAETFDFRTMRYKEELQVIKLDEWQRIRDLFAALLANKSFAFIPPKEILKLSKNSNSLNKIHLESSDQPIPVKKRNMYNLTRWALTGRDNVGINTKCYKVYNNLIKIETESNDKGTTKIYKLWKTLCYLWGSDFRTHIVKERFVKHAKDLDKLIVDTNKLAIHTGKRASEDRKREEKMFKPTITKNGRHLIVNTKCASVVFNLQKGLAIESLIYKNISKKSLIGTLDNGYYNDIALAEDFFSCHTVIEIPLQSKITDLTQVVVDLPNIIPGQESVTIEADIKIEFGTIHKKIIIYNYTNRIDISYIFKLNKITPSSFRTCILTYNPVAFNKKGLYYACFNGGNEKEIFNLNNNFVCGHLLSHLVSSSAALGNTKGCLEIGDKDKKISIFTDMAQLAALPMIHFEKVGKDNYFLRSYYSLGEFDETSLASREKKNNEIIFTAAIVGEKLKK